MTNSVSIYDKKKRPGDMALLIVIYICAFLAVLLLVGIIGYVVYRGISVVDWQFISTAQSALNDTFGILPNIINTLYIIVITLLIATPVGIGSAIYLTEYSKGGRLVRLIEFTTETLSGIPSIIFGLFGMVFFGTCCVLAFRFSAER